MPTPAQICLIGSAGFIGQGLYTGLEARAPGAVVTDDLLPHPASARHHLIDVASDDLVTGALAHEGFDVIINLAAAHRDDVRPLSRYFEVNVTGAEKTCELARRTGARQIIFTSSVAVYGFAPADTGEDGALNPFHEYGRTKALAEEVYRAWQAEAPEARSLAIIRPTVVFGPGNRGNVYNLLRQLASGLFAMIGDGRNVKSMAYVENVRDFLLHALSFGPGVHLYNYVDKPDLSMTELVGLVRGHLGRSPTGYARLPRSLGRALGALADVAANLLGRSLPISAIRVEKFCATTQFASAARASGFTPRVTLEEGLRRTLDAEFSAASRDPAA